MCTVTRSNNDNNNNNDIQDKDGNMPDVVPLPTELNRKASSALRLTPLDRQHAMTLIQRFVVNRLETDLNLTSQEMHVGDDDEQWTFSSRVRLEDSEQIEKNSATVSNANDSLRECVQLVWNMITDAEDFILLRYPNILLPGHLSSFFRLAQGVTFFTRQELRDAYPDLSDNERENATVNKHGAIFILNDRARSAAGYCDGELMVRHPLTSQRHKLGSMAIRNVDEDVSCYYFLEGSLNIAQLGMLLLRTGSLDDVPVDRYCCQHDIESQLEDESCALVDSIRRPSSSSSCGGRLVTTGQA